MMTRQQVLDLYFIEARHKLIELGAFMDRVERAEGAEDFRMEAFRHAVAGLAQPGVDKAKQVLMTFSDPTAEPIAKATVQSACGAWADVKPQ